MMQKKKINKQGSQTERTGISVEHRRGCTDDQKHTLTNSKTFKTEGETAF